MAFVPGYQHDIFISYAKVDDEPLPGFKDGWVTTLAQNLKIVLGQYIGNLDTCQLQMAHELPGNVPIQQATFQALESTATLIVILSEGYIRTPWCQQQQSSFLHFVAHQMDSDARVFVVERGRLEPDERPGEFQKLTGYRFWVQEREGKPPRTLGFPKPQPDEKQYYDLLNDLGYELSCELKRIKACGQPTARARPAAQEFRATVFLAVVSDDLLTQWAEIKRCLDQAHIRVLPERPYPFNLQDLQHAVQEDLSQSALFVQLLSADPGKYAPYPPQGCARYQYALAQNAGKPILQWRSPELDVEHITDCDQCDLLTWETVHAVSIEEFKRTIVQQVLPQACIAVSPKKRSPLVFVNKDSQDAELSDYICQVLTNTFQVDCINPLPPVSTGALEKTFLKSDSALLVYGNADLAWLEERFLDIRDIASTHDRPLSLAIYDGPPEDKPAPTTISSPNLRILNCRECLNDEEIEALRGFVTGLAPGGVR